VEHERDALGRRQRVEHDQHRETDRVRHDRRLLGVQGVSVPRDRFGEAGVQGLLPS
jgi:hypothetical protein